MCRRFVAFGVRSVSSAGKEMRARDIGEWAAARARPNRIRVNISLERLVGFGKPPMPGIDSVGSEPLISYFRRNARWKLKDERLRGARAGTGNRRWPSGPRGPYGVGVDMAPLRYISY